MFEAEPAWQSWIMNVRFTWREDSMEKKKFAVAITDLLLAFIGCLFILSASVVLVLNIRVIYYCDIDTLHLTKEVDLTKEQIRENYDALIDYNLFWKG